MSSSILISTQENIISIAGPVGQLEGVLSLPTSISIPYIAIICHPHPLHGGTMNNKVVHTLVKTFRELGMLAIRFNYRGVGNSAGNYGDGIGETEDVIAVINWAQQNYPNHKIGLAGFSFGAYVSLRASTERPVNLLISIAPAVTHGNFNGLIPNCPWIIIHGEKDELIALQAVADWVATLTPQPDFIRIPGASHFFHGKLIELRTELTQAVKKYI